MVRFLTSAAVHSLRVRSLDVTDAEEVRALIVASFEELEVSLKPPPKALSETSQSIASQIAAGGGVGAEADGMLIGSVLWAYTRGLYVCRLAVRPEWRRRGVARRLLANADIEAQRVGIRRVHLDTRPELGGNLRLFATCGFEEVRVQSEHDDPQRRLVLLEKWLS